MYSGVIMKYYWISLLFSSFSAVCFYLFLDRNSAAKSTLSKWKITYYVCGELESRLLRIKFAWLEPTGVISDSITNHWKVEDLTHHKLKVVAAEAWKFWGGQGQKKIGAKGSYPLKNSSVLPMTNFAIFLDFPSFSFLFSPIFLPPQNFRGTSPRWKFQGGYIPPLCFRHLWWTGVCMQS